MTETSENINLDSEDEGKGPENHPRKTIDSGEGTSKSAMPALDNSTNQLSLLTSAIHQLTEHLIAQERPTNTQENATRNPSVKGKGKGPAKRSATLEDRPAKKRRHLDCSTSTTPDVEDDREPDEIMNEIIGKNNVSDEIEAEHDSGDSDIDETLAELQREYESDDKTGAKLQHNQLAKLVDKMLRHRMSDTALKEKLDRQERPENCENAKPTRVNPGIWRKLRDYTKKSDAQMYKIQQALVKGMIPVIRMTDLSMTGNLNSDDLHQLKKKGLEALSLLSHANYEINVQRKLLMKHDIGKDYAYLCSSQIPFSGMLFGDDLQKQLKDIGDQNKIGAKVQSKDYHNNNSYHGNSYGSKYRNPKNFRGQSYKPWKRKEGQRQNNKQRQPSK